MLLGRTYAERLDHIKCLPKNYSKKDYILKLVIKDMQSTNWKDFYGLSIKETLDLEFSDYFLMMQELITYTQKENQAKNDVIDSLDKQSI